MTQTTTTYVKTICLFLLYAAFGVVVATFIKSYLDSHDMWSDFANKIVWGCLIIFYVIICQRMFGRLDKNCRKL